MRYAETTVWKPPPAKRRQRCCATFRGELTLLGSVARCENNDASDLDIAVRTDAPDDMLIDSAARELWRRCRDGRWKWPSSHSLRGWPLAPKKTWSVPGRSSCGSIPLSEAIRLGLQALSRRYNNASNTQQ